jgi:hypothetical protein
VRATFTFAEPISAARSRVAPHNKTRALNFELDDSPVAAYTDTSALFEGAQRSIYSVTALLMAACAFRQSTAAIVHQWAPNSYNNCMAGWGLKSQR